MSNGHEPAMPLYDPRKWGNAAAGLTKREHMATIFANTLLVRHDAYSVDSKTIAKGACLLADALLEELDKKKA